MANCTPPDISKITNSQKFLSTDELLAGSLSELALELGVVLLLSDGFFIPIAPFIWLAMSGPDIVAAFEGRPKDLDTVNVIQAYNFSAYWPLHALASNLTIALKNGAPISDSRPEIQSQFSAWKLGTIQSIQQVAGLAPGESSPGFWQLQALINTSWEYSKAGEPAVLKIVQAIDCFTEVLAQIAQQTGNPQPPPPPQPLPPLKLPGGDIPGGTPGQINAGDPAPCPPYTAIATCLPTPPGTDFNTDEIGNLSLVLSYWMQIFAIYLANIYEKLGSGSGSGNGGNSNSDPVTCTQLTGLIDNLIAAIQAISISIPPPGPTPEPPPAPDLSAVIAQLEALVSAVNQFEQCVCNALAGTPSGTLVDDAQGKAIVDYLNGKGLIDDPLDQVLSS